MAGEPGRDRAGADADAWARSWAEHLREGGTTPWPAWSSPAATAASGGGALPGAAQLELLRRLNELGGVPGREERVLTRPGPGRGRAHLALPWPPREPVAADRELLRVGAGVLADLTAELPTPRRPRHRRRRKQPAPSFRIEGLPLTGARLRAGLAEAGLVEHRERTSWFGRATPADPDLVLVVVGSVAQAMYEAWAHRVQLGSPRPWARFVTVWSKRDRLPPSVEVGRTARAWAGRVGAENVHVVPAGRLPDVVPRLLGQGPVEPRLPADPATLAPETLDVLRRVNAVLPFLGQDQRDQRRAALVSLAAATAPEDARGVRLRLPPARAAWAAATGVRLEEEVRRAGVVVPGDRTPLSEPDDAGERLRGADVLTAMLRMIRRADGAAGKESR